MQGKQDGNGIQRRAYKLVDAFRMLSISEGTGFALLRQGKINVVRLGPRSPRITAEEIDRILRDGIQ
jgi:hypothetical protein